MKKIYNFLVKHVVIVLVCTSIILVAISFLAPFIFTKATKILSLRFNDTGAIGDTIGGLMNPFIALAGVCVTFLAFYMQYKANNIQVKNFTTEQQKSNELLKEQLFFRLVENLNQRIVNFSYSERTDNNNNDYSSYTALNNVTKSFKLNIEKRLSSFGRKLLSEMPERIPDNNLMRVVTLNSLSFYSGQAKLEEFKAALLKRDSNDRWEYLKAFLGSPNTRDQETLDVLSSIGSVMFYKVELFDKEELYFEAYDEVYSKYGGFIDGYIKNLHYLLKFIEKNDSNPFFSDYILSNITTQEFIIIFYYSASRNSGPDFKRLVKKYDLLNDLFAARDNFIDAPLADELLEEIEAILDYQAEEMLNFYNGTSNKKK